MSAAATPWRRSLAYAVWWIVTRVWAPFIAIGWPVLIVYGLCNPNPVDMERLRLKAGETALLIGKAGPDTHGQRSYVVLPRVLSDAAVVVTNDNSASSMVTQQNGAALFVLLVWGLTLYLTWRYWVRALLAATRGRGSPSRLK